MRTTDASTETADVRRRLGAMTRTDPGDWHLVFRARYGMEVVFRALADVHGTGCVATQLLTCATAVNPILAAGLTPVYGEISQDSLALDPRLLSVPESTRAVVLQHSFGIIDQVRSTGLRDRADAADALLVEDSAHCVGRMARDLQGSPLADVSIHSFGAEKVLPTRFGGAVWVNPDRSDRAMQHRLCTDFANLPRLPETIASRSRLYRGQVCVLNRLPQSVAAHTRDTLTRLRLFEPLIAPSETAGRLPYEPAQPATWMTRAIADHLGRLRCVERRRAAATQVYLAELSGRLRVPGSITADMPLVRFPCFAPSAGAAEHLLQTLTAAGVYAGRWYRPALFPGVCDPARFGFRPGRTTPVTQDLIGRILNLPTASGPLEAARASAIVRRVCG